MSLPELLTGALSTPSALQSQQRADMLYSFQGATIKCVPRDRRHGAARNRARRRRFRASSRISTLSLPPLRVFPPPRAPPRRRKYYTKPWLPANLATPGYRSEPSGAMDNWAAAWKLRRYWEEQTEKRKAAGKTVY